MKEILFCKNGGCSAKLGAGALARVLSKLPKKQDEKLLVGFDSHDDGAVYIMPLRYGGTGIHSFDRGQPEAYPERLEAGTLNVPGIVSLYHSIECIESYGIECIRQHEQELARVFLQELEKIDGIQIYCQRELEQVGIAAFNLKEMDDARVSDVLAYEYGIETRAGAHCAPLVHEYFGTTSMVRVSFGLQNTMEDVFACVKAVREIKGDSI